jgi:hypothetical protein
MPPRNLKYLLEDAPEGQFSERRVYDDDLTPRRRPPAPPASQHVVIDTPHNGEWSGNNQLGITRRYSPDTIQSISGDPPVPNAQFRQSILKLDEWGPPEAWTVSLGINYTDEAFEALGIGIFEIAAQIDFGVGGATQRVLIDWIQGTGFTAPMNALNVTAYYRTLYYTSPTPPIPEDLELSVQLSRGAVSILEPTYGIRENDLIGAGTSGLIHRIPPFCRNLTLCKLTYNGSNPFVAGNYVRFRGHPLGGALEVGAYEANIIPGYGALGIPVPSYAKYVNFVNGSEQDSYALSWIFNIRV